MHALPTKTLDPQINQAPAPVDDVQLASWHWHLVGTCVHAASQWQPVGALQMTRLYLCSDTIKEIGVSALVVGSDGTSGCSAGCPPTHTKFGHLACTRTHAHSHTQSLSLSLCLLHFLRATPTVSAASAISQHRMCLTMAEQRECCVDLLLPEPQQGLDQDAHRHQHVGQPDLVACGLWINRIALCLESKVPVVGRTPTPARGPTRPHQVNQ
jgi:hypothetical protein